MNTQNIENALNDLSNDQLSAIYQWLNWWDGSFDECVTYDLEQLLGLFDPISPDMVRELVKLGDCDHYYLDQTYGLMGYASEGDYLDTLQDNIVDLADYLGDVVGCWIDTDGDIQLETSNDCPDELPESVKRGIVLDVLGDQGIFDLPDSQIEDLTDQF